MEFLQLDSPRSKHQHIRRQVTAPLSLQDGASQLCLHSIKIGQMDSQTSYTLPSLFRNDFILIPLNLVLSLACHFVGPKYLYQKRNQPQNWCYALVKGLNLVNSFFSNSVNICSILLVVSHFYYLELYSQRLHLRYFLIG